MTSRVLARVVLPADRNHDVLPLYVDGAVRRRAQQTGAVDAPVGDDQPLDRHGCIVAAGKRASFATYFNAFPASYWQRWSTVDEVTLRVRVHGDATVVLYRSTARGHRHVVDSTHVQADDPRDLAFDLPLKAFIDGGWYWFDLIAGEREAQLIEAEWSAQTDREQIGSLTIGITTYNRPADCVELLRGLGAAEQVRDHADEVIVVDQGEQRVEEQPDFADATKGLADRLRVLGQGNLGGSGGFARAMAETLDAGRSDYVLLLDDDVVVEPEGISRALAFADLARTPTIVGGHMFNVYRRSVLHAFAEGVEPYAFWWGPTLETRRGQEADRAASGANDDGLLAGGSHDFARRKLANTPWLHRRADGDYNGWWMCLLPVETVRRLGLSLPMFIKWDDAEYGLRAREGGVPTVSLPGMTVWHVPWDDKDDATDWTAYFHCRNRLVAALLHSPYEHGGGLVRDSAAVQAKHLLSMEYSTAEIRLRAIEDVLAGPQQLHPDLPRKIGEVRALRKQFPDAESRPDLDAFPPVHRRYPRKGRVPTAPEGRRAAAVRLGYALARQALPARADAGAHPEAAVPHQDSKWWRLARYDSALVSGADGRGAAWYRRDPERFAALCSRSVSLHARLRREWRGLRAAYRSQASDLVSPERWRETFEASQRD
jgi:galactofuranosylgalactofuranosylrhamnosyl-N-acetylglucosaminyl-diphospho-decaprenol beta-1,5/1,6-galactofuranosyltransferase